MPARREDNFLALNKHLISTIDFRNKKGAPYLHLKDFLISWLRASFARVPVVRQQRQTKVVQSVPGGQLKYSYGIEPVTAIFVVNVYSTAT